MIQRVKYDIAQGTTNVIFIKCKYKVLLTRKGNISGRVIQSVMYDIEQGTTNGRFIKCKYKVSLTRKPNTSGKTETKGKV